MLKEIKNEEKLVEVSEGKFHYVHERIVELDAKDVLDLTQRQTIELNQAKEDLKKIKDLMRKKNDFLSKNKSIISIANRLDDEQFCEGCGMDFSLKENKKYKSKDTVKPYKSLCKKCYAKKVN